MRRSESSENYRASTSIRQRAKVDIDTKEQRTDGKRHLMRELSALKMKLEKKKENRKKEWTVKENVCL